MNSKINIYIWGTGQKAREYLSRGEVADRQLLGFIQSKRTEETWEKGAGTAGGRSGRAGLYIGLRDVCDEGDLWLMHESRHTGGESDFHG